MRKKLLLESHQYFLPDPRLNVADNYNLRYLNYLGIIEIIHLLMREILQSCFIL